MMKTRGQVVLEASLIQAKAIIEKWERGDASAVQTAADVRNGITNGLRDWAVEVGKAPAETKE